MIESRSESGVSDCQNSACAALANVCLMAYDLQQLMMLSRIATLANTLEVAPSASG